MTSDDSHCVVLPLYCIETQQSQYGRLNPSVTAERAKNSAGSQVRQRSIARCVPASPSVELELGLLTLTGWKQQELANGKGKRRVDTSGLQWTLLVLGM